VHNNRFIQSFFAVMLLAIFALSNTPTRVLHQLFAKHTDFTVTTSDNSHTPQLSVAGIDCHCQSNVVMAPYTFEKASTIKENAPCFVAYTIARVSNISFAQPITFALRGPPPLA
jgi:hypothetical protein